MGDSLPDGVAQTFFKEIKKHADNNFNHLNRVPKYSTTGYGRLCGEVAHFFLKLFEKSRYFYSRQKISDLKKIPIIQETVDAHDSLISQEETEKIQPKIDCNPKGIKGILISIFISIGLWCIAIYLAFLISIYLST